MVVEGQIMRQFLSRLFPSGEQEAPTKETVSLRNYVVAELYQFLTSLHEQIPELLVIAGKLSPDEAKKLDPNSLIHQALSKYLRGERSHYSADQSSQLTPEQIVMIRITELDENIKEMTRELQAPPRREDPTKVRTEVVKYLQEVVKQRKDLKI